MADGREVTDGDGLAWTCLQAYAGLGGGAASDEAARTGPAGEVAVVCTPSGGARSVRLTLPSDWSGMDEAALLAAIADGAESA